MTTLVPQSGVVLPSSGKTLADLKSDTAAWLNRSDLSARLQSFVLLAEMELARDVYWRELEPLTEDPQTSYLLSAGYDLYLHQCCKHGAIYLRDADGAAGFQALYDAALARFSSADIINADFATEDGALVLPANVAA